MMAKELFVSSFLITWIVCQCVLRTVDGDVSNCDATVRRGDGIVCYTATLTQDTWAAAQQQCVAKGQNIVSITSPAENDAVTALMATKSISSSWIGAEQRLTTWKWLDGTEISEQGCFMDNSTANDMTLSTVLAGNSRASCAAFCRSSSQFGYAGLEDGTQCRCTNSSFGTYGPSQACFTSCPGAPSEICGGPTSESVISINGGFSNWFPGQPNNGNQYCAILDVDNQFQWNDVDCYAAYGAVCEIPQTTSCDTSLPGTYRINNNNRCIYVSQIPMTYFEARLTCKQNGGDLIMLKTQEDSDLVVTQLKQINLSVNGFWFGLTRITWTWSSGESFLYTNWASTQTSIPNLNCATVSKSMNNQWTSSDCASTQYSICQSTNATSVPIPINPPTTTTITRTTSTTTKPAFNPGASSSTKVLSTPLPMQATTPKNNSILWASIGGAVGGFLLLLVIIIIIIVIIRKKKLSKTDAEKGNQRETEATNVEPAFFFGIDTATFESKNNTLEKNSDYGTLDSQNKTLENHSDYETLDSKHKTTENNMASNQPDVIASSSPSYTQQDSPSESPLNQPNEIFIMPTD